MASLRREERSRQGSGWLMSAFSCPLSLSAFGVPLFTPFARLCFRFDCLYFALTEFSNAVFVHESRHLTMPNSDLPIARVLMRPTRPRNYLQQCRSRT